MGWVDTHSFASGVSIGRSMFYWSWYYFWRLSFYIKHILLVSVNICLPSTHRWESWISWMVLHPTLHGISNWMTHLLRVGECKIFRGIYFPITHWLVRPNLLGFVCLFDKRSSVNNRVFYPTLEFLRWGTFGGDVCHPLSLALFDLSNFYS